MTTRTTQERLEKLVLLRDSIITEANLKGAEIALNSDFPAIISGIQQIINSIFLETGEPVEHILFITKEDFDALPIKDDKTIYIVEQ